MRFVSAVIPLILLAPQVWPQQIRSAGDTPAWKRTLPKANTVLALPGMAARGGVVYVAYRSFDLLRFSDQLQVLAVDLSSGKELQHTTISVPRVHGARASEGFYLSDDGQTLAYVELHDPGLILLLATKDLKEMRRSTVLPFEAKDRRRLFAGFDENGQLSFASTRVDELRFVRMSPVDLKVSTDQTAPGITQQMPEQVVWLPAIKRTWTNTVSTRGDQWREYTESGAATGEQTEYRRTISNGAVVLGTGQLLMFSGNMIAKGTVLSYNNHRTGELNLDCVPRPYGVSGVPGYAGAICTTQRDVLPEAGGDKIVTSEFLLLKTDGPTVAWRHRMNFLAVADGNEADSGFQRGNPLLYRVGSKLLILAPTKKPELAVYEVALPQ